MTTDDVERRLGSIELAVERLVKQRDEDHELLVQLVEQLKPVVSSLGDHENRIRALEESFAEMRGGKRVIIWVMGLVGTLAGTIAAFVVEKLLN